MIDDFAEEVKADSFAEGKPPVALPNAPCREEGEIKRREAARLAIPDRTLDAIINQKRAGGDQSPPSHRRSVAVEKFDAEKGNARIYRPKAEPKTEPEQVRTRGDESFSINLN